ncbi:MAG TPA: tetratricopeptide repeat protein [Gemmatimonadales bacterium]|nr:tetratricopeptide repeat protein [Gemmatimonadales bacterium]
MADESALFQELERLAAAGRHRDVLEALERLPATVREGRTRPALLAAEAYGRLGDHDAAVHWAELARAVARTRGERHAELRARNYQGLIALRHGDIDEAERHFTAALEMARALADHTTEARCLNNLGILANIRGDHEIALANYRLALVAYQQVGHVRGIAETHHNIGISLRDQGNPRAALGAAEEAVRLATQAGDEQLVALASTGRAELHVALDDPALARAELQRAEDRYTRIGLQAGLPEVWRVQAAVARSARDYSAAVSWLERAARLATEYGSTDTLADIERDLSISLAASGDDDGARAAQERAVVLYRKIGAVRAAERLVSRQ